MVACMAVMARETWTDERLDDLAQRMDKGFDEVKGEVRDLRKDMNDRFSSVESRFNLIESRLDAIPRILVIGLSSMTASIVGALLVTQL
jgi:hypothetical protein